MGGPLLGLIIVACVALLVFLVFVVISPLFIWSHLAKLRGELKDANAMLVHLATAIERQQGKTNALLAEQQQQYIKTMQYVCDCLADICDNTGGSSAAKSDQSE